MTPGLGGFWPFSRNRDDDGSQDGKFDAANPARNSVTTWP